SGVPERSEVHECERVSAHPTCYLLLALAPRSAQASRVRASIWAVSTAAHHRLLATAILNAAAFVSFAADSHPRVASPASVGESDSSWQSRVAEVMKWDTRAAATLLVHGIRERPREREWAFQRLAELHPAGEDAFKQMGNEGIDLLLETLPRP